MRRPGALKLQMSFIYQSRGAVLQLPRACHPGEVDLCTMSHQGLDSSSGIVAAIGGSMKTLNVVLSMFCKC